MRIITTREFRENQKSYFDLAEKEKVIVHRGKNRKPVLLTPIEETEESDMCFSDPKVIASILRDIEDLKEGRVTRIKDTKNIWPDIL
ncbi:MAG: prevent-host-death protein [Rikenellaceae bacterium]